MVSYLTLLAIVLPAAVAPVPAAAAEHAPLASADTATYRIDVGHSELTFRIRHLMSRASGTFREWTGTITADPADWSTGSVDVTIQAASIDTRHERRDNDLRSDNFFDVANHPTISFRSTKVELDGSRIVVTGDLTMKGVTKPIVLTGEFLGRMGAGTERERIGFSATGKVNRTDYGIVWNRAVEGGGVLLGDEVEITLAVEAIRM
ncbi:MAG TPA: YceI family protein [Gemmatimonadales bacterium]|nr:YceI family protein [Gemmatimonadales bacterium]